MPNIKEVANRISSVTSTQQLTQAMKMVAVAKLNKVQQQVVQMRPYAEKLTSILDNVTASTSAGLAQQYQVQRPQENILIVVMASDRGMCGSFNTTILKKAYNHIKEVAHSASQADITVLPIGKKALGFFQKKGFPLITDYVDLSHHLDFEHVSELASAITTKFLDHQYDQVVVVYNQFQTAASQLPTVEQFLPLSHKQETGSQHILADYVYEPSPTQLVDSLVPLKLKIQLYKALLESNASEHGARLTNMSKATDNAEELLKSLRLSYNRTRQAAITQEISEIVAGADAL